MVLLSDIARISVMFCSVVLTAAQAGGSHIARGEHIAALCTKGMTLIISDKKQLNSGNIYISDIKKNIPSIADIIPKDLRDNTHQKPTTKQSAEDIAPQGIDFAVLYIAQKAAKRLTFAISPEKSKDSKTVYLTFDDGPINGTERVIEILKEEGIDATMFCIGRHAVMRPGLFKKERGMKNLLIANHTFSHANGKYVKFYSDLYGVMSDVEHAQLVIGGKKYVRLAGRNVWRLPDVKRNDWAIGRRHKVVEMPKYDKLAYEGYYIYGWDIEWHFDRKNGKPLEDAEGLLKKIDAIYRSNRTAKEKKVVLLAHDFMFRDAQSAEELRNLIRIMKRDGWQFKKLSQYSRYVPDTLKIAKYYKPGSEKTVYAKNGNREKKMLTSGNFTLMELNEAIMRNDIKLALRIMREVDVNRLDKLGRSALNTAIASNNLYLVKKLISRGANIYLRDGKGFSPLVVAKKHNRYIKNYLYTIRKRHILKSLAKNDII